MRPRPPLVFALLALVACDSGSAATRTPAPRPAVEPHRAPAPAAPPVVTWEGLAATVVAAGAPALRARATLDARVRLGAGDAPLVLRIEALGLPAGGTLAGGGVTVTSQHGVASVDLPLPDLGAIPIEALDGPVDLALGMPLEIAFPDQPPVATTVPAASVELSLILMDAFARVAQGPVRFTAAPSPLDTAVLVGHSLVHQRVGSGKTLGDIDWIVAVAQQPTARSKTCAGYQRAGTITVRFIDRVLTIYDARTGAVVATEVMALPARCPRFALVRDGEASETASIDEIKRRVAQRLARGSARRAR